MLLRLAQPDESALVAGVLSAAAAKLADRGMPLWTSAEVSEAAVSPHVRSGLYHLALDEGEPVGVFRLQLEDPAFWPDMPQGSAAYLHKLAVVPHRQGCGLAHALLHHAVRLTRQKGRRYLRLDCMAGRARLRAVYEEFGFRHHSQKQMGSGMFDRFEFDVNAHDPPGSA